MRYRCPRRRGRFLLGRVNSLSAVCLAQVLFPPIPCNVPGVYALPSCGATNWLAC